MSKRKNDQPEEKIMRVFYPGMGHDITSIIDLFYDESECLEVVIYAIDMIDDTLYAGWYGVENTPETTRYALVSILIHKYNIEELYVNDIKYYDEEKTKGLIQLEWEFGELYYWFGMDAENIKEWDKSIKNIDVVVNIGYAPNLKKQIENLKERNSHKAEWYSSGGCLSFEYTQKHPELNVPIKACNVMIQDDKLYYMGTIENIKLKN